MTRKEWKHNRKHPDTDFKPEKGIDGSTIVFGVITFIVYAIVCYHFFGY